MRSQSGSEEETGPYELAALLDMFRSDLHPAYANTSRRGRSIGGQAITSQCNYLDPEGDEYRIIERIDDAVHGWFRRAEREGVNMNEVRRRILDAGRTDSTQPDMMTRQREAAGPES